MLTLTGLTSGITATLPVTVQGSTPVASNHHYSTPIGTLLQVNATNGVLAGDVLNGASIFSHTNPLHGVLQLKSDGSFSYRPKRAFIGVDSFTYTLKNAAATSTGTVTIDVPHGHISWCRSPHRTHRTGLLVHLHPHGHQRWAGPNHVLNHPFRSASGRQDPRHLASHD